MLSLLLAACVGGDSEDTDSGGAPLTCDTRVDALWQEIDALRTCEEAGECGQVLEGTSCGCTQDLVVRADADLAAYEALLADAVADECDVGFASDCSCPEADGFACVDQRCTWNYVEPQPADFSACAAADGDALQIDAARLVGETLEVDVAYGGGCADHDISICWPDQSFMESEPVRAGLELWHEDHGDPCDAWITETRSWDLAPLKSAWKAAYGGGAGSMVLQVGGVELVYTFE